MSLPHYYGCMPASDIAFFHSLSSYPDGEHRVIFERLPLDSPRVENALGREFLLVPGEALESLAERAFDDMQFRLRPSYIAQLAAMSVDTMASEQERSVVKALLENASIAAEGIFPICQDTGTASVYGWKGDRILVEGPEDGFQDDVEALAAGALASWKRKRLRNSQVVPLGGFNERNTGDNSPITAHITAVRGDEYRFLFVAKGGGSANKTALFQETKRLLNPEAFEGFIASAIAGLGVSACPPYRIVVILGGQSPEEATLAAKLASTGALDALPGSPDKENGPYRDLVLEELVMAAAASSGWGAQFGGYLLARDARVIRLPRHAASLPVVVAVSCSAHRQAYAYINRDGYFVERLAGKEDIERMVDTARAAPSTAEVSAQPNRAGPEKTIRRIDLGKPGTSEFKATIASLHAGEMVELWGKVILARDAVHARLLTMIEDGKALPAWTHYPVFYASPSGTPDGAAVGSIGPTTSRRMDSYLEIFGEHGIFPVRIGKGERGPACAAACLKYSGAYLAAIGGAAALNASRYVTSCRIIDWPELGMEAVRLVELSGLPALVAVDAEGADYYARLQ